jgi:hypothetical protein
LSSIKRPVVLQPHVPLQQIAEQPWPSFDYKPDVKFSIAHTGGTLYYVQCGKRRFVSKHRHQFFCLGR